MIYIYTYIILVVVIKGGALTKSDRGEDSANEVEAHEVHLAQVLSKCANLRCKAGAKQAMYTSPRFCRKME